MLGSTKTLGLWFVLLTAWLIAGPAPSSALAAEADLASQSLAQLEQRLGASGSFAEPELKVVSREAFGLDVAAAPDWTAPIHDTGMGSLILTAWGLTALAAVLTLLAAWWLSHTINHEGARVRGWTLGARLSLAMGGLTTLMLAVTSVTLSSLQSFQTNLQDLELKGQSTQRLDRLELGLQQMRLASNKFLRENDTNSLAAFTHAIADVGQLIHELEQTITEDEIPSIESIDAKVKDYDLAFSQVVQAIDQRNGILTSQLNHAGPRLVELLLAVKHTAWADNDHPAALAAAETLNELTLARVAVMRYLRTMAENDVQTAIKGLKNAQASLSDLRQEVQNPTRQRWIQEAEEGFAFYAQCLDAMRQHVLSRETLVNEKLDVYGPQIMAISKELIARMDQQRQTLQKDNDARLASVFWLTLIAGIIALIVAAAVTAYLITGITRTASRLVTALSAVAEGDLARPLINPRGSDELATLARATDKMTESLRDVILEVRGSAELVTAGATQIAASSEEISTGMTDQASQVTQVSAAIEEMASSVVEVARKSSDASNAAADAGATAESGGQVVRDTVEGMNSIHEAVTDSSQSVAELGKRGQQIGEVIAVINDIADQTNLLALNAAIEAARAGEHGRGFAVVADEVRKLADRTTKATEEIAESIEAIQTETRAAVNKMGRGTEQVALGVEKATSAGESLEKIVRASRDVATMIQSIAAAAEQQSSASEEVSRSMSSIQVITQESTKGAQQAAEAATSLSEKAEKLNQLVARFKLNSA
jgi:methyl-accepting chemotaxis protein